MTVAGSPQRWKYSVFLFPCKPDCVIVVTIRAAYDLVKPDNQGQGQHIVLDIRLSEEVLDILACRRFITKQCLLSLFHFNGRCPQLKRADCTSHSLFVMQ
jgi:hypothetical protein